MDLPSLLALTAAVVLVAAVALWTVSLAIRDSSIADVAWGPLLVVVATVGGMAGAGWTGRRHLLAGMVTIWGLRLAWHVGTRNRGKGEDPRYARWREEHGRAWPLVSLFKVFLLQGAVLWVVSLPVQVGQAALRPVGWGWVEVLGVVVWAFGFAFEVAADAQLRAFKRTRESRDEILRSGLWGLSRHPNYFGEAVLWWGVWIVVLPVPWGWATAVGPAVLTWLLVRVSGVTMTEEMMEGRPGFAEYVREVPAFVPRW